MNKRLPEYKKVFSLDLFKEYKKEFKPNYILMIIMSILYIGILYKYGIQNTFIQNLDLIKYLILAPMLFSVIIIDYKYQIIPNRLNLTMFEIGLIFAFLYGFSNVAISINMFVGMLVRSRNFFSNNFFGKFSYGKEAMGFGDVKLMGALGLYFGLTNIIIIALISFLIGAISSIFLLVTKIKKTDEYIPFGPFIAVSVFVVIFVPYSIIVNILLNIFTLGLYNKKQ